MLMKEKREQLIKEKIEEEDFIEMIKLKSLRERVLEILISEKGFEPGDIETDPEFSLQLSNCSASVTIDFVINLSATSFMVVKCSPATIDSWERYVLSFARVIKDYQIPYAAVTDGENTKILDVLSASKTADSFYSREEAAQLMENFKKIPCPPKRTEKEKRIIYAFEGIKCSIIKEKNKFHDKDGE
jgi:hypothetical protein